jgi:aldose 1-epimerase
MNGATMTAQRKIFGRLADGTEIDEVTLRAGDLTASIISWGAVIRDLTYRGTSRVLGFDRLDHYVAHSPYFGSLVGRYANRISNGRFTLDGTTYQLERNDKGVGHLHGGSHSFGKRPWQLVDAGIDWALLRLISVDGDQHYPGQIEITCRYSIHNGCGLRLEVTGKSDRATLCNLATHSYFNLDGTPDILSHEISIAADHYTPVDERLIPTGEIRPVAGTTFDFRMPRPVMLQTASGRQAYDHNFVIARERATAPREIARLIGPRSKTVMTTHSTEPGLQFYDGAKLNVPVPGLDGRLYGANAGLCLEPQLFPDTPNRPDFGNAVLRPGETYRQITEYRFASL